MLLNGSAILTDNPSKILSADCFGLAAQKKTNRYSRMVIFFLIQRFFILDSYYKSRMAVFRSHLVIMISHVFQSRIVISISHTVIFESHVVIFESHIVITETR